MMDMIALAAAADFFRPRMRHCRCGVARVDTTDHVNREGSVVAVHGLNHCYSYRARPE